MPRRKKKVSQKSWPEIPSWATSIIAALLAFLATWGALRATVDGLKADVADLKGLVQTVAVLDAQMKTANTETRYLKEKVEQGQIERIRILERVSALEAKIRR